MLPNRSKLFGALAVAIAVVVGATLAYAPITHAFKFGDMMSPGKWMGGGDRYGDDDYDGSYGDGSWGGPYGGGPWGGGPYGGGPWGGGPWGGPGYGAPGAYGAPAYPSAPPAPAVAAPSTFSSSSSSTVKDAEIEALKRRIDELEARGNRPPQPPTHWGSPSDDRGGSSSDRGAAPAFRPRPRY